MHCQSGQAEGDARTEQLLLLRDCYTGRGNSESFQRFGGNEGGAGWRWVMGTGWGAAVFGDELPRVI